MSAFAVFGVSRHLCLIKAKKTVNNTALSHQQWLDACRTQGDAIYNQGRQVMLSCRYDAPQFCNAFIQACDKSHYKDLEIRALNTIGRTKKGGDKYAWKKYSNAKKPFQFSPIDISLRDQQ